MTYTAPVSEMRFMLDHVLGADRLARSVPYVRAFAWCEGGIV